MMSLSLYSCVSACNVSAVESDEKSPAKAHVIADVS